MCRSRRELSNEYLLAKIGVDTAENEPLEVYICKPKFVTCITCNVTCNTCNKNLHVKHAKVHREGRRQEGGEDDGEVARPGNWRGRRDGGGDREVQ